MPIIRSKDCTEILWNENGIKMMQIFNDAPLLPNIFKDFHFMDQRED